MAGPIGNFFGQMAENRHNGRGLIPTLLRLGFQPPVTYQEGIKSVEEYVPEESKRGGMFAPTWSQPGPGMQAQQVNEVIGDEEPVKPAFASLSGSSTARQDYKGVPGFKYPARTVAMDMDAPDYEPNRPDRIDGKDPVTSSNTMPVVPETIYQTPAHRGRAMAMKRAEEAEEGMRRSQGDPRALAAFMQQYSAARSTAGVYDREIAAASATAKEGLGPTVGQLEPLLMEAVRTGNFQPYDSSATTMLGSNLKNKDGEILDPVAYSMIGPRSAEAAVFNNARATLAEFNGLANAPPQTQMAVLKGIAYVQPFRPKSPADVYERRAYIKQLGMRLNGLLNQAGDPGMTDYLNALAAEAAYQQSPWDDGR